MPSAADAKVKALAGLLRVAEGGEKLSPSEQAAVEELIPKLAVDYLPEMLSELSRTAYCRLANVTLHQCKKVAEVHNVRFEKKVNLLHMLQDLTRVAAEVEPSAANAKKDLDVEIARKKAMLLDMDLAERRGETILRKELRGRLLALSKRLTTISARFGKKYGADAQKYMNECLADIQESFARGDDDTSN